MKKILLTALCAMMTLVAGAKDYTETLVVTINGDSTEPEPKTIAVTKENNTISFTLKNLILITEDGDEMFVGNIGLTDLVLNNKGSYDEFAFSGEVVITPGDEEVSSSWIGPMLNDGTGIVPVELKGKINDDKLYVAIDIDFQDIMGQTIYVKVGEDNFSTKNYTETLVVTINGSSTEPEPKTISVTRADNTISFTVENLILISEDGDEMPVGSIALNGLALTNKGSYDEFSFNGNVVISAGNKEGIEEDGWLGPMLGEVPLVLRGKINDNKLYVTIDIDMMESLTQIIYVKIGEDFASSVSVVDVAKKVKEMKEGKATKADVEGVVNSVLNI